MSEINAALQATNVLFGLLKAAHGLSNYNEIVTAVAEVNSKLIAANGVAIASQARESSLINRIAELEREVRAVKDWESEAQRYRLIKFPVGTYAYSLKAGMENGEPTHFICATCVAQRRKSILQSDGDGFLRCRSCDKELQISELPPGQVISPDYDPLR